MSRGDPIGRDLARYATRLGRFVFGFTQGIVVARGAPRQNALGDSMEQPSAWLDAVKRQTAAASAWTTHQPALLMNSSNFLLRYLLPNRGLGGQGSPSM